MADEDELLRGAHIEQLDLVGHCPPFFVGLRGCHIKTQYRLFLLGNVSCAIQITSLMIAQASYIPCAGQQFVGGVHLFPREFTAAEMPVCRRIAVNRLPKIQVINDPVW